MSRELPDWIEAYLRYVQNTEPPRMYHLWSAIAVIASVLQRKCRLDWGSLTFFPNMYTILVGPPAARKGTAMNLARPFLEELQIKMAAEAITREALIRELKNATDTDVTDDGKMFFHSSLTIWSQEFAVFLGYQNQQLMSDLTDWYDCRNQWTYRTKLSGTDEIIGVYVNMYGATTPDLIRSTMPLDAIGGGLTSRIIFVYEYNKGKVVPYPGFSEEELNIKEKLKRDLSNIRLMKGTFVVTKGFLERWIEWYPEQERNPPFSDTRLAGYMERRANHVMKLSMIINASRTDKMVITKSDLERAVSILEETERKMSQTFSGVGKLPYADILTKIMNEIGMSRVAYFSDLLSKYRSDVDNWYLEKIIESLETQKFVKVIHLERDKRIIHRKSLEEGRVTLDGEVREG
jgi:DNA-binding MarR family transcriptional regulator